MYVVDRAGPSPRKRWHGHAPETVPLRGGGYQAICRCGWQGPRQDARYKAETDLCDHIRQEGQTP